MGKNQKTELGRALVRQHNQVVQQTKEKGRFYRKKFLESFTEVSRGETDGDSQGLEDLAKKNATYVRGCSSTDSLLLFTFDGVVLFFSVLVFFPPYSRGSRDNKK